VALNPGRCPGLSIVRPYGTVKKCKRDERSFTAAIMLARSGFRGGVEKGWKSEMRMAAKTHTSTKSLATRDHKEHKRRNRISSKEYKMARAGLSDARKWRYKLPRKSTE
jgi:hypothetical protein